MTSEPVTDWPARIGLTLLTVAAVLLLCWLMWRGWRRRAARQSGLADLPAVPADPGPPVGDPIDGRYLASTTAGDWLDRVVVHGLGVPSRAQVLVTRTGVLMERVGAPDVFIPRSDLVDARLDRGIAGAVYENGGVVVLTWRLGDVQLDTGFRASDAGAARRPRRSGAPGGDEPRGRAVSRAEALLVLEDGRTFRGDAYGAVGETFGEAVFATGMTGYQETLTDPSYHRQVVVMTAPHIGNTGVNDEDAESDRIWVSGYVVRDPARMPSSWRSRRSLDEELAAYGVVGISGVDTRALTRHLRERGAMRVGVSSVEQDPSALLARVLEAPPMAGADLTAEVTTPRPYLVPAIGEKRCTVAALDLGIKAMTPHRMAERGIEVHVLPATSTLDDVLARRSRTGCSSPTDRATRRPRTMRSG